MSRKKNGASSIEVRPVLQARVPALRVGERRRPSIRFPNQLHSVAYGSGSLDGVAVLERVPLTGPNATSVAWGRESRLSSRLGLASAAAPLSRAGSKCESTSRT